MQNPLTFLQEGSVIPFVAKTAAQTPAPVAPPEVASEHPQHVEMIYNSDPLTPLYPAPLSPDDPLMQAAFVEKPRTDDPIPNPEPAVPSLDEPDPGVFHHDPQKPER
jgi:hypothetical protein